MIPVAEPIIGEKEIEYVSDAVRSGWISSKGEYVKRFEENFSKFIGTKYGSSCNNGTSALHLALLALGIKEGDEVIVPTLTYIATANVVRYVGAKPVFVDADRETWNIDVSKIEEKITDRTKAIIPVHLYGLPCEMDSIMEIARKHKLFVIEDCAESHGASYKGKIVGGFGDIGCFSFFGNKIITTGEGGMCVTDSLELKEKMDMIKNQGMSKERRYYHPIIGYNYRMTNVQAALGVAQLESINEIIAAKEKNAKIYSEFLEGVEDVELPPKINGLRNVYWMFSILSSKSNEIMKELEKEGIETRPLFLPLNRMPPYENDEIYPVAEELSKKGINLPSSPKLKKEEIEKICSIIKKVVEN